MASVIRRHFSALCDSVTSRGLCRLCGACALVCPVDVIRVSHSKAELVGDCISCGLCYVACPVINKAPEFEPKRVLLARPTTAPPKFKTCGATTVILTSLLSKGTVDGILVSRMGPDVNPMSYCAYAPSEVMAAGGANYFSTGHLEELRAPLREGKRMAVVGVGCTIEGARLVASISKRYSELIRYSVGLFCSSQLDRSRTLSVLERRGVTPSQIDSMNIREGLLHVGMVDGRKESVRLSALDEAKRRGCAFCLDVENSSADISMGEMGAPKGYVILVVRTRAGEEVLNSLGEALELNEVSEDVLSTARAVVGKKLSTLARVRR